MKLNQEIAIEYFRVSNHDKPYVISTKSRAKSKLTKRRRNRTCIICSSPLSPFFLNIDKEMKNKLNEIVEQIQDSYRKERERVLYSIFDIEPYLENLAEKGVIWILKDMGDISVLEKVGIEYYLNQYQANQIYDNIEEHFNIQTSNEHPTVNPLQTFHTNKHEQENRTKRKQLHYLEVKDVTQFVGYQKAQELEERIFELCKSFPSYERKHIVDQIGRSATSIKERIAMGEQIYIGEKFNQYSISIGSAKETSAWLQISLGQNYITQGQYDNLDNLANQVVSILTKTLCHLKEYEGKGMELPNPYTPNVKNFGAYQNALLLVERIYEMTRQRAFWPEKDLLYGLRQYATSSVANLAEANQLFVPVKFRFFNNALKALNGLDGLLETAVTKGIISEEALKEMDGLRASIRNVLTKKMSNLSHEKGDKHLKKE
jgi:four helix bundle protein